jgi:putative tryptophan/tyrosine transport system substrate-binding protein
MRRRESITLLGSAAVAWPLAARAQRAGDPPRIGYIWIGNPGNDQETLAGIRQGLQDRGYVFGRVRTFAAELVKLAPDVILCYGTSAIAALKPTTQSIPIVFVVVNDPVAQGFIPSVAHPGGTITGFSFLDYSMIGKALGLLKEMAPSVRSAFAPLSGEEQTFSDRLN